MKMFGFAGWNFIGSAAGILRNQGIGILLNLYFNPIVNAAQGIALQVNNAISSFANNFLTAINPQIIKSYSRQDLKQSYNLALYGARFSFLLLIILSFPVVAETHFILEIWLHQVPMYSVAFVRLTLFLTLVESLSLPLVTLQQATGKIRNYQLVVGSMHMLNFPLSWVGLHFGAMPEFVYIVAVSLALVTLYARLFMLKRQLSISISVFHKNVIFRVTPIVILLFGYLVLLKYVSICHILNLVFSIIFSIFIVLFVGLKLSELKYLLSKIKIKYETFNNNRTK